jgi:hypothetical protein
LGVIELQVLKQMLRLDEERRNDGPGDEVMRRARQGVFYNAISPSVFIFSWQSYTPQHSPLLFQ